ncbi:hypothetical protein ACFQHW_02080 [Lapidilactobacillus achengensis]|uniref:Lipoprotein n=1 Tax=Lapidilactobacillus achengensis TaxID=2486000 RepID=A0ABW1UK99_9LACO|nr:hypothetical protein [Lapidilactobacillus achengensis]
MMKKRNWRVLLVLPIALLTLAACNKQQDAVSDQEQAQSLTKKGKQALSDEEYEQAVAYFNSAATVKSTATSQKYQQQAQDLAKADRKIKAFKFSAAKTALDKIKTEKTLDEIKTAKSDLQAELKSVKSTYNDLDKAKVEIAKEINDKDYDKALAAIDKLLGQSALSQSPFEQETIGLLKSKVSILTSADDDSDDDQDSDGSSSSSSSSQPDGKGAIADGKVTSADIAAARKQLESQGVNAGSWSNVDIANAILNARADGRSTIKESDMENYKDPSTNS